MTNPLATLTITTPVLAESAGLYVPTNLKGQDLVLVYDKDNDLVAWGPTAEQAKIVRLAKVYA